MRTRSSVVIAAALATLTQASAVAQTTDSQQILQLLQGMNKRLDSIEQRLDKVEGQPPRESAPDTSSATAQGGRAANAEPGWRIAVIPFSADNGLADTPLARVSAPLGPTKFDLHGDSTSFVDYEGTAFFWAKSPGKYTFNIAVDQSRAGRYDCQTDLKIEDKKLITMTKFGNDRPFTSSGGIELQEGKYQIGYNIACWHALSRPSKPMRSDGDVEAYKRISYDVTVLGPDDDQLREFEPDELFILKK